VLGGSTDLASGHTLLGVFEAMHNDGPWTLPENLQRLNGVVSLSGGTSALGNHTLVQGSVTLGDTVLVNAKVVTVDAHSTVAQALAIRGDKIAAVGGSAAMRKLAGPSTRVIDLGGRTVIPGLIDSHLHAIRAALSFTSEVNWIGARSLPEALARIGVAARAREPGAWLIVAGGWNELQFAERRRPTRADPRMFGSCAAQSGTTTGGSAVEEVLFGELDVPEVGALGASVRDDVKTRSGEVLIPRSSRAQLVAIPTSDGKDTNLDPRSVTVSGHKYLLAEQNAEKSSSPGGLGANKRTGKYVGGGAAWKSVCVLIVDPASESLSGSIPLYFVHL